MAFTQFASEQQFAILDTGTNLALGDSVDLATNLELKYARLTIYKNGTPGGTEQMRINIYSTGRMESPIYQSDWAEIGAETLGTYYLGWIRFDFNRVWLDTDNTYYFELETNNYTRNGDTFYYAVGLDQPVAFNTAATPGAFPAAIQLYGYK